MLSPSSIRTAAPTAAEPDAWPPDLDLESEVCHCLPHGQELPCAACERSSWQTTDRKESL